MGGEYNKEVPYRTLCDNSGNYRELEPLRLRFYCKEYYHQERERI